MRPGLRGALLVLLAVAPLVGCVQPESAPAPISASASAPDASPTPIAHPNATPAASVPTVTPSAGTPPRAPDAAPTVSPAPPALPSPCPAPARVGVPEPALAHGTRILAGRGKPWNGDGGPAADARLDDPEDVLAQADGSVLVVEGNADDVRQVWPNGTITTMAGTGSAEGNNVGGSTLGDGGPATLAPLRFPRALARGPNDSIILADTNHYIIRKVDRNGTITRVAGSRNFAFSGDGSDAISAGFGYPIDVAVAPNGTVYVADAGAVQPGATAGNRVRAVTPDGFVSTLAGRARDAGGGIPTLRYLALDGAGSLVLGAGQSVNLTTGAVSPAPAVTGNVALASAPGGGVYFVTSGHVFHANATDASPLRVSEATGVRDAAGIDADAEGTVFVADPSSARVWRIALGGNAEPLAGRVCTPVYDGPAGRATIFDSQGAAFDAPGDLYFSDFDHDTIRRLDSAGNVTTIAGAAVGAEGSGDGGSPLHARIVRPRALAFDTRGRLLFLDECAGTAVVRMISPGADGAIDGSPDERISTVAGRCADRTHSDHGAADGGPARGAVFSGARGLAVDNHDRLFIADWLDDRIRVVTPNGTGGLAPDGGDTITTLVAAPAIHGPNWLAVDATGTLFAQESDNVHPPDVVRLDVSNGTVAPFAAWGRAVPSFVATPDGLVVSTDTQLWRASPTNGSLSLLGPQTFAGLSFPALSPAGELAGVDNGAWQLIAVRP